MDTFSSFWAGTRGCWLMRPRLAEGGKSSCEPGEKEKGRKEEEEDEKEKELAGTRGERGLCARMCWKGHGAVTGYLLSEMISRRFTRRTPDLRSCSKSSTCMPRSFRYRFTHRVNVFCCISAQWVAWLPAMTLCKSQVVAVLKSKSADHRSKFLSGFHTLIHKRKLNLTLRG